MRGFSQFMTGHTLADLLREDLLAERVVITMYGYIVEFFTTADPVSRRMFEELLKDEEDPRGRHRRSALYGGSHLGRRREAIYRRFDLPAPPAAGIVHCPPVSISTPTPGAIRDPS